MFSTQTSLLNKNTKSLKALTLMSIGALITACGGGAGTPQESNLVEETQVEDVNVDATAVQTLIEGTAVKGAIENGIIRIYPIESVAGLLLPSTTSIGNAVRTNQYGEYELSIEGEFTNRTFLIEMTADEQTLMTCDATQGCGAGLNGVDIEFGDKFSLSADFNLRTVVTGISAGAEFSASLNPLTHMAVAQIEGSQQAFSELNISNAFASVEASFGLSEGALQGDTADITRLEAYTDLSASELELGIISASFLSLVGQGEASSIEEVINDVEDAFRDNGGMQALSSQGDQAVSLEQVLLASTQIAEDLENALPDSQHLDTINLVSSSTSQTYEEVMASNQVVSLAVISSQPQNVSATEGDLVELSVVASGDNLNYQWNKNGVAIQGATSSVFEISDSQTSDAGFYNVVITNSAGQVESLSAVVSVAEAQVVVDGDDQSGSDTDVGSQTGGSTTTEDDVAANDGSGSDTGSSDSDASNGDTSSSDDVVGDDNIVDVVELATIVTSPLTVSATEGDEAVFSVAVTGSGTLTYQWRKDGQDISGATSNTLTLASISEEDVGSYDVVVSNEAGAVTSDPANLLVQALLHDLLVSWDIPLQREDGQTLEIYEIDGYQLSFGTDADNLNQTVVVDGASETSVTIDQLGSGTYFFSIATIDSDGLISANTGTISISI